jgi:hypothetical protein
MDPLTVGVIGAAIVALLVKRAAQRPAPVAAPVSYVQPESPLRRGLRPPVTERQQASEDEEGSGGGAGIIPFSTSLGLSSAIPDVAGLAYSTDGGGGGFYSETSDGSVVPIGTRSNFSWNVSDKVFGGGGGKVTGSKTGKG